MLPRSTGRFVFLACLLAAGLIGEVAAARFEIEKEEGAVAVTIDGRLFTRYILESAEGGKPYFWPLNGPDGVPMTRAFPMEKTPGGSTDHPHHRSIFFGHQSVDGVDFWLEKQTGGKHGPPGHATTTEVVAAESGPDQAVLHTRTDYCAPDGRVVLKDERRFVFREDPERNARIIDVEITFIGCTPSVTLGDAKDAGLSIRVADTMAAKNGGGIVDARGAVGEAAAYGKKAPWCDFHGPNGGRVMGVAMLQHPDSWGFPAPWHVRSYGLMTSNPFGLKSVGKEQRSGALTISRGERATLKYRIILHEGDEARADIAGAYREYAASSGASPD